jgi:DUF2075 family protein
LGKNVNIFNNKLQKNSFKIFIGKTHFSRIICKKEKEKRNMGKNAIKGTKKGVG